MVDGFNKMRFAQQREVARPVANLGNTCYMNAILQALAHAPELCNAMDCEPHSAKCPIELENRLKFKTNKRRFLAMSASSSRSPSPAIDENEYDSADSKNKDSINNSDSEGHTVKDSNGSLATTSNNNNSAQDVCDWRMHVSRCIEKAPTRKSRRAGKKSPVASCGMNASSSGNAGSDDENQFQFCALCEIEHHLDVVHSSSRAGSKGGAGEMRGLGSRAVRGSGGKPVAPTTFVHGFIHHVAPWFRLGVQEDSHEFLRLLIDAMQKSCKKARSKRKKSSYDKDNTAISNSTADAVDSSSSNDKINKTETTIGGDESNKSNRSINGDSEEEEQDGDVEYPFQLFRGTVESNVTCGSCKASSSTFDPIEDVGLDVTIPKSSLASMSAAASPSNAGSLADVSSAFHRFTQVEELDAGYKCEKCGKVGSATKQSRLASIPPILTLHLKRFSYGGRQDATSAKHRRGGSGGGSSSNSSPSGNNGSVAAAPTTRRSSRSSEVSQLLGNTRGAKGSDFHYYTGKSGSSKIEGHVKFDMVIDLKPYLTIDLQRKHSSMFCRLFAVVVHAGKNSHSGHYISYVCSVKNKNEWWKMDDSRVTMVSVQEVMNAEAYMLFYRVVDHPIALQLKKSKIEIEEQVEKSAKAVAEGRKVEMEEVPETVEEYTSPLHASAPTTQRQAESSAPPAQMREQQPQKRQQDGAIAKTSTGTFTASVSTSAPTQPHQSLQAKGKGSHSNDNNRKRNLPPPEVSVNESLALASKRLQGEDVDYFSKIKEYISDDVELNPSFFKIINEEASKSNAKLGKGPHSNICADDIVGGRKKYSPGLREFLYRLATNYEEKNKGESFLMSSSNSSPSDCPSSPATTNKKQRFAIEKTMIEYVEATDENLL